MEDFTPLDHSGKGRDPTSDWARWTVPIEVKERGPDDGGGPLRIRGMASTDDVDVVREVVEPSAFKSSLESYRQYPVLLFSHNFDYPVGKVTDISISERGLPIEATISEAPGMSQTVARQIEEGVLSAFSIGFRVKDVSYDKEREVNRITDLDLVEISVVPVPANAAAKFSVAKGVRALLDEREVWEWDEEERATVTTVDVPPDVAGDDAAREIMRRREIIHARAAAAVRSILASPPVVGGNINIEEM